MLSAALAAVLLCSSGAAFADNPDLGQLQQELQRLQSLDKPEPATPNGWKRGAAARSGEQLRARLQEWGYDPGHGDAGLEAALKDFQRVNHLKASGVLDANTRKRLQLPREARIARLSNRLDTEAEKPVDMSSPRHIVVNIPAFRLRAYEDGKPVLESPVVVGRPKRPTPELSVAMRAVKYNPTWTAPPTIVKEDLLPLLSRDPAAFARRGMVVLDSKNRQISPSAIGGISPGRFYSAGYRLVQPAGDRNALGKLKFEITNTPSVYMHDTNHRSDFGKPVRALSSGCVRVQQYLPLAAWLLSRNEADIQSRIDRGRTASEAAPDIPVDFVYWLAEVNDGHIVYLDDVYDRLDQPRRPAPKPAAEPATPSSEPSAPAGTTTASAAVSSTDVASITLQPATPPSFLETTPPQVTPVDPTTAAR